MLTLALLAALSATTVDWTVRANGADVHVRCAGDRTPGAPLVLLEAGAGNGGDTWIDVQTPIAEFARACAYDRPTLIRGSVGPRAGDSPDEVIATLRAVLAATGEKPPYVMVGHSYGGMIVRLYATRYPSEVAGIVLVDSSHEDQLERIAALDPQAAGAPPPAVRYEALDLPAFCRVLAANRWHASIPLAVLTHGTTPPPPAGREAIAQAIELAWLDMQRELATRSPKSSHVVAKNSGHYIQRDEPGLVVDAVRRVTMGSEKSP